MKLTVEFLGVSRRLAQTPECQTEVPDRATFRDVLREIATRFPALQGAVIDPTTHALLPEFMLNIGGRQAVTDLDAPAQDGQRLLLMFLEAGG